MSLFQSNLRKQIRNLPKLLNFVKIIHYYSKLFTGVLSTRSPPCRPPGWQFSRRAAGRPGGAACANVGRRGMGRRNRENANCGDPVGTLPGPRTFRRGLIGKIRQIPAKFLHFLTSEKIPAKNSGKKFRQNMAEI